MRSGKNISTPKTREFRQKKAQNEANEKIGWLDPSLHRKNLKRGIQGYYFNKSLGKYVWLRSTYEYIYAKWLDATNQKWDIEVCRYTLKNNELYTPDFFIYSESGEIHQIIEIKGYWRNRDYKPLMLKEQNPNLDIITIYDIELFIPETSNYPKEKNLWKEERKIKCQK